MKPIEEMSQQEKEFRSWYRAYVYAKEAREHMKTNDEFCIVQDRFIELLNQERHRAAEEWYSIGARLDDVLKAEREVRELVDKEL